MYLPLCIFTSVLSLSKATFHLAESLSLPFRNSTFFYLPLLHTYTKGASSSDVNSVLIYTRAITVEHRVVTLVYFSELVSASLELNNPPVLLSGNAVVMVVGSFTIDIREISLYCKVPKSPNTFTSHYQPYQKSV